MSKRILIIFLIIVSFLGALSFSERYRTNSSRLIVLETMRNFNVGDTVYLFSDQQILSEFDRLSPDVKVMKFSSHDIQRISIPEWWQKKNDTAKRKFELIKYRNFLLFQWITIYPLENLFQTNLFVINFFGIPVRVLGSFSNTGVNIWDSMSLANFEWFEKRSFTGDNLYLELFKSFEKEFETIGQSNSSKLPVSKEFAAFANHFECEMIGDSIIKISYREKYLKNEKYFLHYLKSRPKADIVKKSLDSYPLGIIKGVRSLNSDWYLGQNISF